MKFSKDISGSIAMTNTESRTASTSPHEILIAARKMIEMPENWGKGIRGHQLDRRPFHTCCASEAIEDVTYRDVNFEARRRAYAALGRAAGLSRNGRIIDWNDAPERTHAEVLAAFDSAIEQCAVGDREGDATPQTVA